MIGKTPGEGLLFSLAKAAWEGSRRSGKGSLAGTWQSRPRRKSSDGTQTISHASTAEPNCPLPSIIPTLPPSADWKRPKEGASVS
jgi:hypothetical protein